MRPAVRILGALTLTGALAVGAAGQESPVGGKAQLGIFADTMKTIIPGLEGVELPPQARAALGGLGGQRMLRVHLWTPAPKPPADATASLDIPSGLQLGATLPLELPKEGPNGPGGTPPGTPGSIPDFEFLRYWGCSTTVRPGQPKVFKSSDLPAANLRVPALRGAQPGAAASGPAWTDAHWPNSLQRTPSMIQAGAALPGKYALKSSYTPGVSFEIPASLNFLAPVELSIPKGTDPAKTIPLSWKPVPGAVGYVAMAVASKGRNRSVMWTSVETDGTQFPVDFNSPEKVKELIEKGLCMPPDKTQCNIPATAFEGCDGVSIQLFAFGPAFEQAGSTPSVRVQTRSMAMMVLQKGQD